jgi:CRP-like cAMP-binding protein
MGRDANRVYQEAPGGLLTGMRNRDSVADALGRTARYGNIARRERQAISQASTLLCVPAGAVLAREGTLERQFVIVLAGAATIRTGDRVTSALLAGDHFGALGMFEQGPNKHSVVAETAMTLAVVGPAEFGSLIERSPSIARAVIDGLAGQVLSVAHAA